MRRNTLLPALLGWATVSGYDADPLSHFYPDICPIFSTALTADKRLADCEFDENCGKNCGTFDLVRPSGHVTGTLPRSKWGWSIGDSNPGPLACQARAGTVSAYSSGYFEIESP